MAFWVEFTLDALITPVLAWLLLTLLASYLAQHLKSEENLGLYHNFTRRLSQAQELDELAKFLTQYLGLILSVEHITLYRYDHLSARLALVTDWNALTGQPSPISSGSADGQHCDTCQATGMRHRATCESTQGVAGSELPSQWCVPLVCNRLLVGILRGRTQPGHTLAHGQIDFLDAVSPEIALALVLALSRQPAEVPAAPQLETPRKFSWVMHNTLDQQVGSLHLSLERLAKEAEFPRPAKVQEELEYLTRVAGEAHEQTQSILALLRPGGMANLSQVLASYARWVAQRANLQLEWVTHGKPRLLPQELCQSIFGVMQECLHNVEKHAHAGHLLMTLDWSTESLSLSLDDDGVGFAPSASSPNGHSGVVMMREWIAILGGELTIRSSPGQGTRLNFKLPYHPPGAMRPPSLLGGEAGISPAIVRRILEEFVQTPPPLVSLPKTGLLTARELEILRELARGATNHMIAEKFVVSENTVKNQVHSILIKLNVRSRREIAHFGRELGLPPSFDNASP